MLISQLAEASLMPVLLLGSQGKRWGVGGDGVQRPLSPSAMLLQISLETLPQSPPSSRLLS